MANPKNPIIFMDVSTGVVTMKEPANLENHPNRKLEKPKRCSDYTHGLRHFWFEEMIMESFDGVLKRLAVCPETKFLMYLQSDLPLKWIMFDPVWGNDSDINAQFQAWVVERTVLDATEDRS